MSDKEDYIERLDKIQRDIDWIIRYLLKKDEPTPLPPYPPYPNWPESWPPISNDVCPQCNLIMKDMTGYVCPNMDCPTQMKVYCGDPPGTMCSGAISAGEVWTPSPTDENNLTSIKIDNEVI